VPPTSAKIAVFMIAFNRDLRLCGETITENGDLAGDGSRA